jgi:hypothetical protein
MTRLTRGVAQPGSASVLGTEGRRFESCLPDQLLRVTSLTENRGFQRLVLECVTQMCDSLVLC